MAVQQAPGNQAHRQAAADGRAYVEKFSDPYSHRVLDGIGHNMPEEAPDAFADAVLEVEGSGK